MRSKPKKHENSKNTFAQVVHVTFHNFFPNFFKWDSKNMFEFFFEINYFYSIILVIGRFEAL